MTLRFLFSTCFLILTSAAHAQFVRAVVAINGVTCSLCSVGIEKSLLKLDFVERVQMDLNKNITTIQFKNGKEVKHHAIATQILDAGFSIESLKTEYNFDKLQISEGSYFVAGNEKYYFIDIDKTTLHGVTSLHIISKETLNRKEFQKLQKRVSPQLFSLGKSKNSYLVSL